MLSWARSPDTAPITSSHERVSVMATVDLVSVGVKDFKGKTASVVVAIPTGNTLADITLYAQAFAGVLDAVTDALVQSITVTLQVPLPGGLKVAHPESEDIGSGANFGFDCANTNYRETIRVPAILSTLRTGDLVDMTDPVITVFTGNVINGVAPVLPSDHYGNDITAALQAVVTFRKE